MSEISERVSALRAAMKTHGIDAYIIPSSDPHQSEYVSKRWQGRKWISNFDGSAGTAVITQKHAGLWTDSRYFLQAENQLDPKIFSLHKMIDGSSQNPFQWLAENLKESQHIGFDGMVISYKQLEQLKKLCADKDIGFKSNVDLLDEVWQDRPARPDGKIFLHSSFYTGVSRNNKLNDIEAILEEEEIDHYLVSSLDDIAWLLNIRSSDIDYNPVCLAYFLFSEGEQCLFIDEEKLTPEIKEVLEKDEINILPYDEILNTIEELDDGVLAYDPSTISSRVHYSINCEHRHVRDFSSLKKAKKNLTEIQHIKNAMLKDGHALIKAFMWLEANIGDVSEYEFSEKIGYFRSQQKDYFGESFNAIVGYKGNAAIVHYRARKESCAIIKNEGFLLVDCGAQYLDGTTDITRTFCFSKPTAEQKQAYTAVLKGHINLASTKFPQGTNGGQLDALARKPLWELGLNYLHGTGHGVGFFLNVHEKPQGFAAGKSARNTIALEAGMLTSNEPGYYKTGEYGIRIENLVLTVKSKLDGFLEHETLSLFPIETKMLEFSMLTKAEVEWLNAYHATVFERLEKGLDKDEREWLQSKCIAV